MYFVVMAQNSIFLHYLTAILIFTVWRRHKKAGISKITLPKGFRSYLEQEVKVMRGFDEGLVVVYGIKGDEKELVRLD